MSTKFSGAIAGKVDVDTPTPLEYGVDQDTRSMPTNLRVWDSGLLQWVRMTQPLSEGGTVEEAVEGVLWEDLRYEYSSGNCVYKGMNETMNASVNADTWYIIKYEYDGDGNCTRKRVQLTSWTNRATGWT